MSLGFNAHMKEEARPVYLMPTPMTHAAGTVAFPPRRRRHDRRPRRGAAGGGPRLERDRLASCGRASMIAAVGIMDDDGNLLGDG
jgi:hypothetical protein